MTNPNACGASRDELLALASKLDLASKCAFEAERLTDVKRLQTNLNNLRFHFMKPVASSLRRLAASPDHAALAMREAPSCGDLPKRPFAFAVQRAPENGTDEWRLFRDEAEARVEAEQLDGEYEALFRVGDRRSAVAAAKIASQIQSAARVWLECPAEKRPSSQALGNRIAEIASGGSAIDALPVDTANEFQNSDGGMDRTRGTVMRPVDNIEGQRPESSTAGAGIKPGPSGAKSPEPSAEPVAWRAYCPSTGGYCVGHEERTARSRGDECYSPHEFVVQPLYLHPAPAIDRDTLRQIVDLVREGRSDSQPGFHLNDDEAQCVVLARLNGGRQS